MNNIFIEGGFGNHGRDLISRDIFGGAKLPILVGRNQFFLFPGNHAVITPIRITNEIIKNILSFGNDRTQIVNFSGIMGTSTGIDDARVTNIHCLFGPGVNTNLTAVVTEVKNDFSLKLERNLEKAGIKLLEMSPENHDEKMAIIQGLANFCEVILGFYFGNRLEVVDLLSKWQTNATVIEDMIFLNKYFDNIRENIYLLLNGGNDLSDIFLSISEKYLSDNDFKKLCTPNFLRVFDFFSKNKGFIINEYVDNSDNFLDMISIAKNSKK
ncbi:MAG: hypothetical protein PHV23_04555 [Candidatus Gracilibacteria bacterium]|nr:hypothetical protein [Candidatus Gracilibacteria bacterium]